MEKTLSGTNKPFLNALNSIHFVPQGYSPIHPASWRNDLKVIKMCEEAGANMNHITKTGWSTLTCSLKNENADMGGTLARIEPTMEYLLDKGDKIGIPYSLVLYFCTRRQNDLYSDIW